jgi:hypothetical protein
MRLHSVLRPSTEKFDAPTSLEFEVVLVIWQCRPLTLNQDIIQVDCLQANAYLIE